MKDPASYGYFTMKDGVPDKIFTDGDIEIVPADGTALRVFDGTWAYDEGIWTWHPDAGPMVVMRPGALDEIVRLAAAGERSILAVETAPENEWNVPDTEENTVSITYHPNPEINAGVAADVLEAERIDLAIGYPPRHWTCPCGASHSRGHFGDIGVHRCLGCGYVGTGGVMFDDTEETP